MSNSIIRFRRGTAAAWTSANPILTQGESGWETDTGKFKVGDGVTHWTSLSYSSGAKGDKGDKGDTGAEITSVAWNGNDMRFTRDDAVTVDLTGAKTTLKGDTGDAATIAVGTVTDVPYGTSPTVTNVGTSGAAIFDFELETGATGATGATGSALEPGLFDIDVYGNLEPIADTGTFGLWDIDISGNMQPNTATVADPFFEIDGDGNLIPRATAIIPTAFSNPMTTLGDIIYEDAVPAANRLAGNTVASKKFLSQTGTGSVSAVPSWQRILCADIDEIPTDNFFLGSLVAVNLSGAQANVSIGKYSSNALVDGVQNVSIGYSSLASNQHGGFNMALGALALANCTASNFVGVGYFAGYGAGVGSYDGSIYIGKDAGKVDAYSNFTVAIGKQALFSHTDGDNTVAIGTFAGYSGVHCSGNIYLGWAAGAEETGNDKLYIDNRWRGSEALARSMSLIYGIMAAAVANQYLTINGNVLISQIKSGATQLASGAAANELWKTASHATLPDNVVMIGV